MLYIVFGIHHHRLHPFRFKHLSILYRDIERVSHDPLTEQRLLQTQATRHHIERAERKRQRSCIYPEPKRTYVEHAEKARKENPKSAENDRRDFVVGFTTSTAITTGATRTRSERVTDVRMYYEQSDIEF